MFLDLILLNLSIIFILFLPGYFLVKALGKNKSALFGIETLALSIAVSIAIIDFIFLFINKLQVPITLLTSILFPGIFIIGLAIFYLTKKNDSLIKKDKENNHSFSFTKVFIFLILLIVVIKVGFLFPRTIPSSTDLGHHMYWSKYIKTFNQLPDYGAPDFIIGEHIIFGIISITSGISLVSTMPIVILFLINFFSLLALSLLGYEIAINFTNRKNSKLIALIVFLAIGAFYAISSPQTKYVSGGVIGNLIGNLFIPLIIFSFLKALRTKKILYAIIFAILLFGIIFTHHLSTFIFLFVSVGFLILTIITLIINLFINKKDRKEILINYFSDLKVFINFKYILFAIILGIILFISRIPSYLNPSAVDTAVGTPTKSTRIGLELIEILETAGPWRFFYAGICLIFFALIAYGLVTGSKKIIKKLEIEARINLRLIVAIIFPITWFLMIFIMSYQPGLLKIDIPSGRIASYISYPTALLSGFGIFYLLKMASEISSYKKIFPIFFIVILGTGFISGFADISTFYEEDPEDKTINQVFAGSEYLSEKTNDSDVIIKDHIYMPADTWIKLFLMREYKNPLSRSYLKRYDDPAKDRETCTRDMIAIPDSEIGKKCFEEYNTNYVFLKKGFDNQQFENSPNFSKIFSSEGVVIFQKN